MLQKHIIKITKKLIDFVRYLLEHKDNNNFYTKAEADCYQRFINSVTPTNINEMLHYLRQYGGDLKNYYTVPNYFLVNYSFYPGWSLFYFDKQFNPDLLKFFGIDLNEFKYLFSKYEELSDTDQTRRYRQKKFLAFCFALSWVEAVKILAYEENNQKAKEYLNLIEFREFCSNDKSAGNLFNKLVERVKAQNIPANYLDASYYPTSIRFDRYMYFIDNSIIITREDNNPKQSNKQGNKQGNKAGLTQTPAPAPAVVNNVMTLEPYDEDFTAFTGDFSDLDISASLNDWEAGGYSKTEINKNEITAPKFEIIKALDENYFNLVFDKSKIKDVEKFKFNLALYYSLLPLIEEGNYYLRNSNSLKDFQKIRAKLSQIIGADAYKCGLIPMSWLKNSPLLDMQHYRNIVKFLGLNTKGLRKKKDYFLLIQSVVNHEDYLTFLKKQEEFFNNCVIVVSNNSVDIIDERKKNNVTMPA